MPFITTELTSTYTHLANTFLAITKTGSIVTTGTSIVGAHDGSIQIIVDGSLYSDSNGIEVGLTATDTSQLEILIGSTGVVRADSVAFEISRQGSEIVNNGEITGSTRAIHYISSVESGIVTNSGIINSFNSLGDTIEANGLDDTSLGQFTINNSGEISNSSFSNGDAISITNENLDVTNSGLIQAGGEAIALAANSADTNSLSVSNSNTGQIIGANIGILGLFGIRQAVISNDGEIKGDDGINLTMSDLAIESSTNIANTGIISGLNGTGIFSNDANFYLNNSGTITGSFRALDVNGAETSQTDIRIVNSGVVSSDSSLAVNLENAINIRLVNSGDISSNSVGIRLETIISPVASMYLLNSGTISGGTNSGIVFTDGDVRLINSETGVISSALDDAIQFVDFANDGKFLILNNSGLINGGVNNSTGSSGNDALVNFFTGIIRGDVQLAGGEDRIINQGVISGDIFLDIGLVSDTVNNSGSILGNLTFGAADDDILVSAGMIDGDANMGSGNDLARISGVVTGDFVGGGGNDRLFLSGEVQGEIFMGDGNDFANLLGGNVTRISGGDGNDTYVVDKTADVLVVTEEVGEGTDLVRTKISYRLSQNVENLQLVGAGQLTGTGNDLDNVITGNSENNQLEGLDGNDNLIGAGGNDTLLGGNGDDTLQDSLGANNLFGGAGNDTMTTGIGEDQQFGGEGDDLMFAGGGDDLLVGGDGFDRMNGGTGADVFDFNATDESSTMQADRIFDFENGIDLIDLSDIFGDGVGSFIGTSAFSGTGGAEVGYAVVGTRVEVYVDADGDGMNDMTIFLLNLASVDADDFVLG